jgi:hypothetical protein
MSDLGYEQRPHAELTENLKLKTKLDKNPHLSKYDKEQRRELSCPVCTLTVSMAQKRHFMMQTFCFGRKDTQAAANARKAKVEARIRVLTKESNATEQPPPEAMPKRVVKPGGRPGKERKQMENPALASADFSFSPVDINQASMSRCARPTQQPAGQLAAEPLVPAKQRHSPRKGTEPPPKPPSPPMTRVSKPVQPIQAAPFLKGQRKTPKILEGQQARESINTITPKGKGNTAAKGKGKTTKTTTKPSADAAIAEAAQKPKGKWVKKQPPATPQRTPTPEQSDRHAKPRQRKPRQRDPG